MTCSEARQLRLPGGMSTLVDSNDYDRVVSAGGWRAYRRASGQVYVQRRVRTQGRWSTEYLHRFLVPDAKVVDHVNGNGLDNRRLNLRGASQKENMRNARRRSDSTSGFKGVSLYRRDMTWAAYINDGRKIHLGYFRTAEEAAHAYDRAATERFGAYAKLNFTEEGVQ